MVRNALPSKGCKPCRQRKIKCDEKLPACTQCIAVDRECPGPIVGNVFVDMGAKMKLPAGRKREKSSRNGGSRKGNSEDCTCVNMQFHCWGESNPEVESDLSRTPTPIPISESLSRRSKTRNKFPRGQLHSNDLPETALMQLPTSYQPSRADIFQELFVSHFLATFDNTNIHRMKMPSFFSELPSILSTSLNLAVLNSIRSAMMIHYGTIANDIAIQKQAHRSYAQGMQSQRSLLERKSFPQSHSIPTAEDVLSPIMLSMFELVASTTPLAWAHHLLAAASMLEMRGPENCQDGFVHVMFRSMRITTAYISITAEELHLFSTKPWLEVPFLKHPKTINDRLIDILLLLPGCMSRYKKLSGSYAEDKLSEETEREEVESNALAILSQLKEWWREYAGISDEDYEKVDLSEYQRMTCQPRISLHGRIEIENDHHHNNSNIGFKPTFAASYHAANMIIYSILALTSSVNTPQKTEFYESFLTLHAAQILSTAAALMGGVSVSDTNLVMVFPLKTVYSRAVQAGQRMFARELLSAWGRKRALEGICGQDDS